MEGAILMTVQEILNELEAVVPLSLSESWDHSGFQLGSMKAPVDSVAFALDATLHSVTEALSRGCQLLVTHHPLFFHPLPDFDLSRFSAQVCAEAIKGNLAIASWHTCWDSACGGVNEGLLKRAGLQDLRPLAESEEKQGFGLGGVGRWTTALSMSDATRRLAKQWNLSGWQFLGEADALCSTVALCGGSGGELWPHAVEQDAQLYVTAEMKHHQILEALESGLHLMICDHGEMEEPSMEDLAVLVALLCHVKTTVISSPVRRKLQWFSNGN